MLYIGFKFVKRNQNQYNHNGHLGQNFLNSNNNKNIMVNELQLILVPVKFPSQTGK